MGWMRIHSRGRVAPTLRLPRRALSALLIPREQKAAWGARFICFHFPHICGEIFRVCRCSLEGAASANAPPVEISDWLIFSALPPKGTTELGITLPTAHSIFGMDKRLEHKRCRTSIRIKILGSEVNSIAWISQKYISCCTRNMFNFLGGIII